MTGTVASLLICGYVRLYKLMKKIINCSILSLKKSLLTFSLYQFIKNAMSPTILLACCLWDFYII